MTAVTIDLRERLSRLAGDWESITAKHLTDDLTEALEEVDAVLSDLADAVGDARYALDEIGRGVEGYHDAEDLPSEERADARADARQEVSDGAENLICALRKIRTHVEALPEGEGA